MDLIVENGCLDVLGNMMRELPLWDVQGKDIKICWRVARGGSSSCTGTYFTFLSQN